MPKEDDESTCSVCGEEATSVCTDDIHGFCDEHAPKSLQEHDAHRVADALDAIYDVLLEVAEKKRCR